MKSLLSSVIVAMLAVLPVNAQQTKVMNHPGFVDQQTGIRVMISNYSVYNGFLIIAMQGTREQTGNTLWFQIFSTVQCSTGEAYYQGLKDYNTGNFIYANTNKKPVYIKNFYKGKLVQDKNLVVACQIARQAGFQLK